VLDSMPIPPKAMRGFPTGALARRVREIAAVNVAAEAFFKKDRRFTLSFLPLQQIQPDTRRRTAKTVRGLRLRGANHPWKALSVELRDVHVE
jgi:hypothetical protein